MSTNVEPANGRAIEYAVVGSFTTEKRHARGAGIELFRYAPGTPWQRSSAVTGLINPSYLLVDPRWNIVYAAHGDADIVTSYSIDRETGVISQLSEAAAGGHNGVALALHPSGRLLFVANYASGSISTVPIIDHGRLADATNKVQLPGEAGPHKRAQTGSHPHDVAVEPTGRFLVVPDKGLDRIFVLEADPASGALSVHSHVEVRPGAGPRHIAFHPVEPRAYVVGEIDSTLITLDWEAEIGRLTPRQVLPILPDTFFGANTAAEIVLTRSGRYAYVSNRGADNVARIWLDESGYPVTVVGWTQTNGAKPRFMTLSPSGQHLVVANEQGDNIVEFAIDPATGDLSAVQQVRTVSPSAVRFIQACLTNIPYCEKTARKRLKK